MLPSLIVLIAAMIAAALWLAQRSKRRARALEGDVLKRFFQSHQQGREVSPEALAGMLGVRLARVRACLRALIERGLVRADGSTLFLTPEGQEAASALVRSHRVLETYLSERAGRPLPSLHRLADRLEHRVTRERIEAMDRGLGHPVRDPHGDLIPGPRGRTHERRRVSLAVCPAGSLVRVLHVEDEPDALLRELLDRGVAPAAELEVLANDDAEVRVSVAGSGECRLDAFTAAMVDVVPSGIDAAELRRMVRLNELGLGRSGRLVMLTNELRGDTRRRLLDLGFTPGAVVTPVLENALGGDPTAYLIRQSRIALRRAQARHILVARASDEPRPARGAAS